MFKDIPLTLGIEEEYQIVDPVTRDLHSYMSQYLAGDHRVMTPSGLKPELMESQLEMSSHICNDISALRNEIIRMRKIARDIAQKDGLTIVAASTHPFAKWSDQNIMQGDRYSKLLDDFRSVAQQLLVFGMHIHVGFGDSSRNQDIMIEIMNQMRYFLPHILALSSSSPFWQGRNTGLMSYRSVVFEMMPRSGIPPSFQSHGEYEQYVDILGQAGSLDQDDNNKYDATKIWWDIRPHPKFGTLEIRIADVCTDINDTIAIAALIQAIIATLLKLRSNYQSWRTYRQHHIMENKWRAVRYGTQGKLIDFGIGQQIDFSHLAQEILEIVDPVLDKLNSRQEVQHIEKIVDQGNSASQQIAVYNQSLKQNTVDHDVALHKVVDYLASKTVKGL